MDVRNHDPHSKAAADLAASARARLLEFPRLRRQEKAAWSLLPVQETSYCPSLVVVYSPCGGSGKTGLVANLGRALALGGEEVLLIDTSQQENLFYYFGVERAYPGEVRTAYHRNSESRLRMAALPVECHGPGGEGEGWLRGELAEVASECDRVILDLSSASRWLTQQIFSHSPLLLVPVMPDWTTVLSLAGLEEFLREFGEAACRPNFVVNQFHPGIPFHGTVLSELRTRLGGRVLPQVLHRSLDVDEALAQGMTVVDYEPEAQISRDYRALAEWVRSQALQGREQCSFA